MPFKQVSKNRREIVRIMPTNFKGHELIDIRVYAPSKEGGELIPTRKGIAVAVDIVPELIEALTWALGQECSEDGASKERVLSPADADELARSAWDKLRRHGSAVHWDSAERIVLGPKPKEFSKWDLHYVLFTRKDLFDRVDSGCFKARSVEK
jgi:hypothetical protein